LAWFVTTVSGLVAGSSKKTGSDKEGNPKFSWLQLVARIAPPVFVVGLVLLIATLEQLLLAHGQSVSFSIKALTAACWRIPDPSKPWSGAGWHVDQLEGLFLVLLGAGGVLAWRVDINEFSMHHFYKNRLVRCYMGASNVRCPRRLAAGAAQGHSGCRRDSVPGTVSDPEHDAEPIHGRTTGVAGAKRRILHSQSLLLRVRCPRMGKNHGGQEEIIERAPRQRGAAAGGVPENMPVHSQGRTAFGNVVFHLRGRGQSQPGLHHIAGSGVSHDDVQRAPRLVAW
jgi:hypothetical protein